MHTPISFPCGLTAPNRFVLAPLTNQQSHEDGTLSFEESRWLSMRAKGGFGLVMTCAAFVSKEGIGFEGQMGIVEGLSAEPHLNMNAQIHEHGALSIVQLYHAGSRADTRFNGGVVKAPSSRKGIEGLSLEEVKQVQRDFVEAAKRCQEWGYDGVQLHAAHGYLLCEFLSDLNERTDDYGGDVEGKVRILVELIEAIRATCGPDFLLSVRLSPERFSLNTKTVLLAAQRILDMHEIDLLDWSLWDVGLVKDGERLLDTVLGLEYGACKTAVAGKIDSAVQTRTILEKGVDMAGIGRGGILHHDFPKLCVEPDFTARSLPVTEAVLYKEGLSAKFIQYLSRWENFVLRE